MRPELVCWAHYQRNTPNGVKRLRAKAQSRLYLNINILLSERHTSNISPVKVRAQKKPKQNYINLCINSTIIHIREVGKGAEVSKNRQRRMETESVFTRLKCEKNNQ